MVLFIHFFKEEKVKMRKMTEGVNINGIMSDGFTMKGLSLRWSGVLFLLLSICLCLGCGGSDGGDDEDNDETAAAYAISGTVGGDAAGDVTVTLSGDGNDTATTDSSGNYSFTVSAGTYAVTPTLYGYSFTEASESVTVSSADVDGVDFTSVELPTYILSGTVSGDVAEGVTIALSVTGAPSGTTDATGYYSLEVVDGTYTVIPTLSGYTFNPTTRTVTINGAAYPGVDFTDTESSVGDRTDYSSITLTSGGVYSSGADADPVNQYQYTSTIADVPSVKVAPGGSLELTQSKAVKSGDTDIGTEDSGFYGFNAGVLASSSSSSTSYVETGNATSITMTDCTITTDAIGANGAFAFGEGAVINLDHVTIVTTGDNNSRGVDATYGGTVNITNSKISTQGGSCAALATDRYNNADAPKINATNVEGSTAGTGSPGIYCTGTFVVEDSKLAATGSEAVCIEGKNSVTLTNTTISGVAKWGVIIYQSMSGDSSVGTGNFTMTGGTLTNTYASGPAFFVCDTAAVIELDGVAINNSSDLLLVAGKAATAATVIGSVNTDWGSLGGTVTFTATNQTLEGEIIICDASSSIDLTLSDNSILSGAIKNPATTSTEGITPGEANLTIDSASNWTATANSVVDTLTLSTINSIDAATGVTINVGTLSGVTVTSPYTLPSGGTLVIK